MLNLSRELRQKILSNAYIPDLPSFTDYYNLLQLMSFHEADPSHYTVNHCCNVEKNYIKHLNEGLGRMSPVLKDDMSFVLEK